MSEIKDIYDSILALCSLEMLRFSVCFNIDFFVVRFTILGFYFLFLSSNCILFEIKIC